MPDFVSLNDSALSYLVEINLGLTGFIALKLFHVERKVCEKIVKIVTALSVKFPDLAKVLGQK